MTTNKNLQRAQRERFDEFYTRIEDIQTFFNDRLHLLNGKTIYMPCDSAASAFWRYFTDPDVFHRGQFAKVIATHLETDGTTYKMEYDGNETTLTPLTGNGDFRSPECQTIWATADVIVTNPPFSLFRDFFGVAKALNKPFIVLCSYLAPTYSITFDAFRNGDILQYSQVHLFNSPDGTVKRLNNICWCSYLFPMEHERLTLSNKSIDEFEPLDNYTNVYECGRVSDLPNIPNVIFAVPVSYCPKHNPEQIEIVGVSETFGQTPELGHVGVTCDGYLHGERIFKRLFVRVKNDTPNFAPNEQRG